MSPVRSVSGLFSDSALYSPARLGLSPLRGQERRKNRAERKIFLPAALDTGPAGCYNTSAQRSRYGSPSSPQASAEGSTGTTLRRFSGVVLL